MRWLISVLMLFSFNSLGCTAEQNECTISTEINFDLSGFCSLNYWSIDFADVISGSAPAIVVTDLPVSCISGEKYSITLPPFIDVPTVNGRVIFQQGDSTPNGLTGIQHIEFSPTDQTYYADTAAYFSGDKALYAILISDEDYTKAPVTGGDFSVNALYIVEMAP